MTIPQSIAKIYLKSGKQMEGYSIRSGRGVKTMKHIDLIDKRVAKLLIFSLAIIVISGQVIYAYFTAMRNSLREEIKERLMAIAFAATFLISPDEHQRIAKAGNPDDPLYRKVISRLRTFAEQTLPEVRAKGLKMAREAIYTLVPLEGKNWYFVLDTSPTYDRNGDGKIDESERQSQIGEEIDVSAFPEMIRCFKEKIPTADTDLTVDKWGVWLSGYAPLKDEKGKVVAIVGVNMNLENLMAKEGWLFQISLFGFVAVILTTFLVSILFYRRLIFWEQLSRAKELQRRLAEVSADLIFSLKTDGTISEISPQIRSYGYEPSSLVGKSLMNLLTFEEPFEFQSLLRGLQQETGKVQTCLVNIRTSSGQIRQGELRCFSVCKEGQIVEVWAVFRDLSEILLLTKELRSKTEELTKLYEEQSYLLEDIRRQAEELSVLDRLVLIITQRREIISIAQTVIDELKPLYATMGFAVFRYAPSSESLQLLAGDEGGLKFLNRLLFASSQIVPAEKFQILPLLKKGETVKIDDLTEFNSEFAKALLAEGYRSAVACPLHVGEDFLGFLIAFHNQPKSFTEDESAFLQQIANHLAIALHNARLFEELMQTCEELRQTQAFLIQQERLNALGQMASGISHDIGNALVPLLAYSEVLNEHSDPKIREWGRKIAMAADDIMHIVQRLRAFYRPRDPNENLEPINLNEVVKQVVDLTRPRWYDMPQREGITIEMVLDLDENLPSIEGVPAELREALTNLIFNAVDAIITKGETEGRIEVRTSKKNSFISLEVTDTGVGMDEDTKKRCFEPFFTTKGEKGSGLGLMMVYGVMQRHEGKIEIESELGKGTTFRLLFPIKETRLSRWEDEEIEEIQPLRILLVDDDPRVRLTLGEFLKSWGHTITNAESGTTALDAFTLALHSGRPFDVVITDLGMPKMNGAELVRKIREQDQNVPIIIITAWGKDQFIAGANATLSKPVKSQDLKTTLAKVVHESKKVHSKVLEGSD